MKKTLIFLKYVTGTIGISIIIADYKWVGVTCLIVGAISDAAIKVYYPTK